MQSSDYFGISPQELSELNEDGQVNQHVQMVDSLGFVVNVVPMVVNMCGMLL